MYATKVIGSLFALKIITIVVAQASATGSYANPIDSRNVTTDADDYINENRRIYNATLKSYLNQIDTLKNNLENELKVIDKQNAQLLKTIKETYERIEPLELISLSTKYCVQRYRGELPYLDTIKANIETCTITARSYITTIITPLTNLYNQLYNYYYIDFKNALAVCQKSFTNPSLNYTLCITTAISKVNTVTNGHRDNFATALQGSDCTLNSRIDVAVSCTYLQYNTVLASIGAVDRLINDCISGYLENRQPCPSNNVTVVCPNVLNLEVEDSDFQNNTIINPLQGFSKNQKCLELRFV